MTAIVLVAGFVIGEVLLRVLPIPGVAANTFYYDELTGGLFYPGSTFTYRNDRGDVVKRRANSWGFLDEEHKPIAPAGTMRIGFFGDSYTESRQVPLEQTFFRRIEKRLNDNASAVGHPTETLAFGIGGRSTVQSYLECQRWLTKADLDMVVYVFCENDPGDQIREIKKADSIPYVVAVGDSFVVDTSFRERYAYKKKPLHQLWQRTRSKSLLASTIHSRLKLLRAHGIKTQVTQADRVNEAGVRAPGTGPSTWPNRDLLVEARRLTAAVIETWRDQVVTAGRGFVIMYVPSQRELGKPEDQQDSWLPWLREFCLDRGIGLVDPSPELIARRDSGQEVYYDHFTPAGHAALSEAFIDRLGFLALPDTTAESGLTRPLNNEE